MDHDLFNVLSYRTEIKNNLIAIHPWLDPDNSFALIVANDGVFNNLNEFFEYFS